MTDHLAAPRIAPLPDDELSSEQADLLAPLGDMSGMNIFSTLVRHPRLYRRWAAFAGLLLRSSSLPARDREVVILRAAWRSGAEYEWGAHVRIGREAGLSAEEILAACDRGTSAAGDALLIRAVDELHEDHQIGDDTWAQLAERYDELQLIELPMLAGQYVMLAGVLNSLGVQPEAGVAAFGEV